MAKMKDNKMWNKLVYALEHISPNSSGPKYEQYGCYCFQRGLYSAHFTGRGVPVDEIDEACFKFHQCQKCLGIDHGKKCTHTTDYEIQYAPGTRQAKCMDEEGSCGRSLCDCVVAFAQNIAKAEANYAWNVAHSKYSSSKAACYPGQDDAMQMTAMEPTTTTQATTTTLAQETENSIDLVIQNPNVRARLVAPGAVQLKSAQGAAPENIIDSINDATKAKLEELDEYEGYEEYVYEYRFRFYKP